MMSLSRRKAALQAETSASLANQAAVSKKQHYVRPLLRSSSRRSQTRPWSTKLRIEDETRVEEVKSQVETVFNKDEMIDVNSCTKGHSYKCCHSLRCPRLSRKTHRSLRKNACTGTWHRARVQWQVLRAGQSGFHHQDVQHEVHRGEGMPKSLARS